MSPGDPLAAARSILIVDDDSSVRVMLARLVQREGYIPLATASGTEGFTRLIEHADRIALIFVDLRMPDMDGFGFRSLQLESPDMAVIPTVVMSGHSVSREDLARLRPTAWLPKPASVAQFQAAIRNHARRS